MVEFRATVFRDGLKRLGIVAGTLVLLLVVWLAARANRPAADEASAADSAESDHEPTEVRLDRPALIASAGIEVATVESRPIETTIACNGSASFNQNQYVKVPPKADGILRKIQVDVGTRVRGGETMAVVDSNPVGDLKADFLKAIVHEEHLRWQIKRFKEVGEGIAGQRLVEAEHLLEEQEADTYRIKDRLRIYGFSPGQVDDIVRNKDLGIELPVVAPRDGVIVERHAVEGEPVQTTMPLFAIADLDTMWVILNVYESHLRYIHLDQSVKFFPDGLPGEAFVGKVTWISPQVDPQTRTIQVRAQVANRDGALRANMFGKGELLVDKPQDRLVVPQAAVQTHDGGHVVFVEKPKSVFEVRRIVVGLKDRGYWEVTQGLAPGDRVATTGSFLLKSNLENPEFGKEAE